MTIRLYYDDPYSREFDGIVTRVEPRDGSQAIWLDRSSFYPTSGGQPFDTGTLGGGTVVDVVDEEGDVVHMVQGGNFAVGATVHGAIDWARRFDHMQQHTGQHILSAAFIKTAQNATVSFHLGAELSTIDLSRDGTADHVAAAEALANAVLWENRPVSIQYTESDEAGALGLRKASKRTGTLRLIDIADFDLSACGGAHVSQTGAVGVIVVTGWERFKGGMRVEFACGGRVVRRHAMLRDVVSASARALSALPQELPAAIERLQGENKQQKKRLIDSESQLARFRAQELAASAVPVGGIRFVSAIVDAEAPALKTIAVSLVASPNHLAVLCSMAAPFSLVVMRSADVTVACDALVRHLCERFGGRGGGRPDMAQGGGLSGTADEILEGARQQIAGG